MMDAKEQEFLKRLRVTFRLEAEEHLRALSAGLIELEKTIEPARRAQITETIFREAHSLKGAARSVNLKDVESTCQPLESALAALKRQQISVSPALFDLLHQAVDTLAQLVSATETERPSAERARIRELNRRLAEAAQGSAPPDDREQIGLGVEAPAVGATLTARSDDPVSAAEALLEQPAEPQPEAPHAPVLEQSVTLQTSGEAMSIPAETVRIPITKLDPLLLQAEEMIQVKLAGAQRAAELREIQQALVSWKMDSAKWQEQRVAQSNDLPDWVAARLEDLIVKATAVSQAFEQDQRVLRRMVDDHLLAMKHVLMLPVSTLVEVFPRLVRDLARDQGKAVDLIIQGSEIEIDKRILEELKDPLIHLVRNSVDHGIEKPEIRARHGKPERGTLSLTFNARDSRQVEILVADDGAGIDADRVRAAAIKAGVITAEAAGKLGLPESLLLVFQSGLSTSEIITDISGRGLGLAIMREKVEKLGGQVSVDTRPGVGTTFRLLMPLTLTTFRGVLVRAMQQVFVLPTTHIERALRINQTDIQTIENRETIRLDGQILSLVKLGEVLALPVHNDTVSRQRSATKAAAVEYVPVLILTSAEKRLAVQVDEVLAEEEVLVKGLGRQTKPRAQHRRRRRVGCRAGRAGAQRRRLDEFSGAPARGNRNFGGRKDSGAQRPHLGGGGFDYSPHAAQEHPGNRWLSGDYRRGRRRCLCSIAQRRI